MSDARRSAGAVTDPPEHGRGREPGGEPAAVTGHQRPRRIPPDLSRARFRSAAETVAGLLMVLVVWQASGLGSDFARGAVSDTGFVLGAAAAALACGHTARHSRGRERRAWALLCAGAVCWFLGNLVWTYSLLVVGQLATPGPADVAYLSALVLVNAGMVMLVPARPGSSERLRAMVDGLILSTSLLFLSWLFILEPLWESATEGMAYRLVTLAYPVGDVVLVTIAASVALRGGRGSRLPFLLAAAGMAVYAVSDSGLAYLSAHAAYRQGTLLDAGWIAGYLLVALAALAALGWHPAYQRPRTAPGPMSELLPYLPAVLALSCYYAADLLNLGSDEDAVELLLSAVLVGLVLLRQVMTILQNERLTRTLEEQVQARTRELARLGRKHASILESAGDGILGLDGRGTVTFVNRAGAALLDLEPERIVGRRVDDVAVTLDPAGTHPWQPPSARHALSNRAACARHGTGTLLRPDGRELRVDYSVTAIAEGGPAADAVVVFRAAAGPVGAAWAAASRRGRAGLDTA